MPKSYTGAIYVVWGSIWTCLVWLTWVLARLYSSPQWSFDQNYQNYLNDPGHFKLFSSFSFLTSVSQRKQDHRLHHRTYIASLLLLGTTKCFFYPLVELWPGPGQTLKMQKWVQKSMPTHKTTSDPLYNSVQPISEGYDQRGPTFKSLTRPWSFAQKSCNGASKSCNGPSISYSSDTCLQHVTRTWYMYVQGYNHNNLPKNKGYFDNFGTQNLENFKKSSCRVL